MTEDDLFVTTQIGIRLRPAFRPFFRQMRFQELQDDMILKHHHLSIWNSRLHKKEDGLTVFTAAV